MWSCGARTHPGWIQGSTAVFTGGVVGLIRYTVWKTGLGLRGPMVLSFSLNRHQPPRLHLRLVAPLTVSVTQLKTLRSLADNFRE